MSICINCKSSLEEKDSFCPTCGFNQVRTSIPIEKTGAMLLRILCVLTILGSFFTIGRAILYEAIANVADNDEYIRGWIYGLSSIVTFIGALLMFNEKRSGLITYSIGQSVYIITVIWATSIYVSVGHGVGQVAFAVSMMFMIPSILFLWMYWTKSIRSQLN
jgi:hypothetical protein